jgi:hypothetical protein
MEKIDIYVLAESVRLKLDFLVEHYDYVLTESRSNGIKSAAEVIYKLSYLNNKIERNIEIVLIGTDYTTHMFSCLGGIYIMRTTNSKIPDYKSKDNCYCLYNLEDILPKDCWFFKRYRLKDDILESVITGKYWPEFHNDKTYGLLRRIIQPLDISSIKERLNEVLNYGYIIEFDESDLPPYEQSIMGARIAYKNMITGTRVDITFQSRDQEFYISSSSNRISRYGRTGDSDYEKLKQEMINVVNKAHNNGIANKRMKW